MESKEYSEGCGNWAGDAPKHNAVVVELDSAHVVFFYAERLDQPQTHVDQDEKGNEWAGRLLLLVHPVFCVHIEAVYDQHTLQCALHNWNDVNWERQTLTAWLFSIVQ